MDMDRRQFLRMAGVAGATAMFAGQTAKAQVPPWQSKARNKGKNVAGLVAPKMDTVRLGMIGVGARGGSHVEELLLIDGVEIKAIADPHLPSTQRAVANVVNKGRPEPTQYTNGDYDYRHMLERDDIDAVVIATPWEWHTPMAVEAMKAGKHAFIEVPASTTVDGCWQLVETAENTRKHCMMLENVCYGREELMVLNMVRQNVLGELLHGEAAYIHDLREQMNEIEHGTGSWRTLQYTKRNGNLYPTHGLGPVAQYMNINRGDRFDYMSSVSSNSRVRGIYAAEHYPADHPRRKLKFVCGDINTSIIRTVNGRTIMVQWDEQLPRPYTRLNLIQGTRGVWGGFPNRVVVEGMSPSTESWEQGDALKAYYDKYDHPLWKKIGDEAVKAGGHGGMDFVMWWRLIYCLRNGLPLDQDVYDAASWSAIGPISEYCVKYRGRTANIPDFTGGNYKTNTPLGIVS